MDLTVYDIIRGVRITEKVYKLNQRYKQLVLEVHVQAKKPQIAQALKKLFNVEVEKICTSISKGKKRRVGRHIVYGKKRKKAIITLKEGYSVDLMGLSQTAAEGQDSASSNATR
jgi:large subunit ribosomal protein L23